MIAYTRAEIISATDLARNVSGTLNSITNNHKEKIAISKNNKLEAVILNIEEYERLKEAYEYLKKENIISGIDSNNLHDEIETDEGIGNEKW